MDKHSFKVINTDEFGVYRILDLTDTSIVGITELYDSGFDRDLQVEKYREIRAKRAIGAKVVGYDVFIVLDEDNMPAKHNLNDAYLRSVLRQMASFFKETIIDKSPALFKDYITPKRSGITTNDSPKAKRIDWAKVIWYIGKGIAACIILGVVWFLIWFIFFRLGGIIGWLVFILCAIAFIPELFR